MTAPVPAGACDCHVHVIGPKAAFPLAPERTYTPMDATAAQLEAMMGRLALSRAVIVQPSIYGTDNRCTLEAVRALGPDRARAVAVLAEDTAGSELDRLHGEGVRGLRLNIASIGAVPIDSVRARLRAAAEACARNGWHVQMFVPAEAVALLAPDIAALPAEAVFDHFALIGPQARGGEAARALAGLLERGNAWVKLSGTYRIAEDRRDPAIADLARDLARANPERLVWGSDWPHTPPHGHGAAVEADVETPYRDMDTADLLADIARWFPEDGLEGGLAERVLVANPARLYGFG